MKTLLICHEGAPLDEDGMARWLASFSEPVGVIVLREKGRRKFKRIRREIERVGVLRFLDVTAFRLYYRIFLAQNDERWENEKLSELRGTYPKTDAPVLMTYSPNSKEAEEFIKAQNPDVVIARCKVILNKRIFSLAKVGTFVMHPGICPEYRNAHGCFWALVRGDFEKVGIRADNPSFDFAIKVAKVFAELAKWRRTQHRRDRFHDSVKVFMSEPIAENKTIIRIL